MLFFKLVFVLFWLVFSYIRTVLPLYLATRWWAKGEVNLLEKNCFENDY